MQKNQKNFRKKLKAYFLAVAMGTASTLPLMAQAEASAEPTQENKAELTLAEMDPTNKKHIDKLKRARNGDDDFINDDISVAQFHAMENAYVNDAVQLNHLTDLGLKTSEQTMGRSKDLNDNVDFVLECRDKVKTNPLVRSAGHKRQMVRECAKAAAEANFKEPTEMLTAYLSAKDNDSELSARVQNDPLVGRPANDLYVFLHRAMIDPEITLEEMTSYGMLAYDNDSDDMDQNAGHVIECRDKSFAEDANMPDVKRTEQVRGCTKRLMAEYNEPQLDKFDHIVPSLYDNGYERFENLSIARYRQYDSSKVYGDFNWSSHKHVMRASYTPEVDLETLRSQATDDGEYSAGSPYVDENLAVFISVRDALFETHGVPDTNDHAAVRAFQKMVIEGTMAEIKELSDASLEDFAHIPTHEMHPKMHEKVLEKRILNDDMVANGENVEEYVWLEKAMYDAEVTIQTLIDNGLDRTSGQKSLTGHAELVVETRDKILATPEGQAMDKTALRDAIRAEVFPQIIQKHEQAKQEEKEVFLTIAKIAGGVAGLAVVGFAGNAGVGAYRRRRNEKQQRQRRLSN